MDDDVKMKEIYFNDAIVILGIDIATASLVEYLNRENYYNTIIIEEESASKKETILNDIFSMTGYIVGKNITLDRNNILIVNRKNLNVIRVKASAIVIMNKKYLRLFPYISRPQNIKLNHMFQTAELANNIFISPTIILGNLPKDIKVKIGKLMGKQINLKLIGEEDTVSVNIICRDPHFSYIPHRSPSKGKIVLIYKSTKKLEDIKVNEKSYKVSGEKTGILVIELEKILKRNQRRILIRPNPKNDV